MSNNIPFWAIVLSVMFGQWIGDFIKGFVRGVRKRKRNQRVVKSFSEMTAEELDEALERLI